MSSRVSEQRLDSIPRPVNHLLHVGFYLLNFGFVSLALQYGTKPFDVVGAMEFLSTKIGLVMVVIGAMNFFNIRWLVLFRKSTLFNSLSKVVEPAQTETIAMPQPVVAVGSGLT
jgi:hypothetical protein